MHRALPGVPGMKSVTSHHLCPAYFSLIKAELRKEKSWTGQITSNVKFNRMTLGLVRESVE